MHLVFDKYDDSSFKVCTPKPEKCLLFYLKEKEALELNACEKKIIISQLDYSDRRPQTERLCRKIIFNFQIVFQPTALFRPTGIPSHELTNKYINAESVFLDSIRFFRRNTTGQQL